MDDLTPASASAAATHGPRPPLWLGALPGLSALWLFIGLHPVDAAGWWLFATLAGLAWWARWPWGSRRLTALQVAAWVLLLLSLLPLAGVPVSPLRAIAAGAFALGLTFWPLAQRPVLRLVVQACGACLAGLALLALGLRAPGSPWSPPSGGWGAFLAMLLLAQAWWPLARPEDEGHRFARFNTAGLLAVGALVLCGWWLHAPMIVQGGTDLVPTQFNTAVSLVLCGIALHLASVRRRGLALVILAPTLVAAVVTLFEEYFGSDAGVDQLLFVHHLVAEGVLPGRMAPNTAVSLLLLAAGIALYPRRADLGLMRHAFSWACGLTVTIIAVTVLVAYLVDVPGMRGWGLHTPMALMTAIGLAFAGLALARLGVGERREQAQVTVWVPMLVALGSALLSTVLWYSMSTQQASQANAALKQDMLLVARNIAEGKHQRIEALRRLAMRLASTQDRERQETLFRIDANIHLLDFPSLDSLVWLDNGRRQQVRVDREVAGMTFVPVPTGEARLGAGPDADSGSMDVLYLRPFRKGDRLLQWVELPVVLPDGGTDGYVLGLFDVAALLQRSLVNVDPDRPIRIRYGQDALFAEAMPAAASSPLSVQSIPLGAQALTLEAWSNTGIDASRLPSLILFSGLVLGGLLAVALRLAALARLRATAAEQAGSALRWQMVERERTQARLDESNAQLGAIIEGIGDGFVMLDEQWRFVYLNQRAEVILHRRREELIGRNCWLEFPEAVGTPMQLTYERAVREGTTASFEAYYPPLEAWLEIRAHPHPRGLAVYFQDISERHRQREALDRSTAALADALRARQLIMDSSLDVICSFDADGRFVEVSAASELVWGYRPEEMIGHLYFDWVHPDDLAATRREAAAIMAGQATLDFRNRYLDRDGRPVHMQWSAIWSAEARRTFCVARDITELERRKSALLKAQESLLRAQEIGRLGSWELDVASNRLTWSEQVYRIFGITPAHFSGYFDLLRVHPDDRPAMAEAMAATIRGEGDLDLEHRIVLPDGTVRVVHERARLLRDERGRPELLSGTVQDVSERKQLEALESGKRAILEQVAARQPLAGILEATARLYESQRAGALCSVLLIEPGPDGARLRHGAAPSLPAAYSEAIDGAVIGEAVGSCGTAAWRGEQVIVADIAIDPLWRDYAALAREHGLAACWSTPVRDSAGRVTATFAVYYRQPQAPSAEDLALVEDLSALVSIALEQARAFRDLSLSEQRFRSLFDEHPDAVYAMDRDGRFTACNQGFETLTGSRADQVIGQTFDALVAVDEREFVRERFARAAGGEAVTYEARGIDPSGRPFETRVTNLPIMVEGEVVGVFGIAHDISALRRHERALAAALERSNENSLMMRRLSQAAIIVNQQLDQDVDIRQELVDLLRDTIGAHQAVLSLTQGPDWAQSINAVSLSSKYAAWRDYVVPPDGSGIYAIVCENNRAVRMTQAQLESHSRWRGFGEEASAHPPMRGWLAVPLVGRDGRNIGLLQLSDKEHGEFTESDELVALQFAQMAVTALERSRLIEQLRERDRFFELSVEVFVIYQPATQRWLQVNPMFTAITGYSQEELLGRNVLDFLHPDDRAMTQSRSDQLHAGLPVTNSFINRYICKDGSVSWIEWVSAPGPGGVVYAVGRDVTLRRKAEAALQESLVDLSNRNRELQDFAFVASHDLQEPLRKIRAFSDRLATRYRDGLEAQARDYLERMNQAAARMQALIDDLLAYSRVSTRAKPFVRVNLAAVVAEVTGDLEARIEQTGARISVAQLPTISADPMQMRQLFQNLLANALKFHAPDRAPEVTIDAVAIMLPEGAGIRITVADNGIGFEEKYAERIFTPFQRLHARADYEGTGIGLAIVRRIVERHRGRVAATGRPGEGARFMIDLPLAAPQPEMGATDAGPMDQ